MKIFKYALLAIPFLYFSCDNDDDTPDPVNEEEVITTMNVTLVAQDGSGTVTMSSVDNDGEGPNQPVVTGGTINSGTAYTGMVEFLNELESPAEDITEEVMEEADEHQVFFTAGGGLDVVAQAMDADSNGNPLGVHFELVAGSAGSGTLTITLVHEPEKPNDGLSTAGGETDIEVTFDVVVE
tara:strand:+ start:13528 stop:14073 length:546 start_codon:yes stop_codon:yes gene_type:complete